MAQFGELARAMDGKQRLNRHAVGVLERKPGSGLQRYQRHRQPVKLDGHEVESRAPKAAAAAPVSVARSTRTARPAPSLPVAGKVAPSAAPAGYGLPSQDLLQMPPEGQGFYMSQERMEQNADLLESVLEDFGVKGQILNVRPGPVVALYELEPAPGIKSSRVIGLADDIARSMSALSARVAVVQGRNVIGIDAPAFPELLRLRQVTPVSKQHRRGA